MCFVYVIQSEKDDSFYIGKTNDLNRRLQFHNSEKENAGVTRLKIPCNYFFALEGSR